MQMIAILLIEALNVLMKVLKWFIIIQCLMSWFPGARYSRAYEILSMFTEPLLGPIREVLFRYIDIPIDFSPIIAFFVISFVTSMVQRLIITLAW